MIEGLKVTVDGTELMELCFARAKYHDDRAIAYKKQIDSMELSKIEGMQYTNGDPIGALRDKLTQHVNEGLEMEFIANHIVLAEEYLLDSAALHKLGICKSRY